MCTEGERPYAYHQIGQKRTGFSMLHGPYYVSSAVLLLCPQVDADEMHRYVL